MLQKEFKSRRKVKDFAAFSLKYKLTRKEKYKNLLLKKFKFLDFIF